MRIAKIINKYEATIADKDAQIAALTGEKVQHNAQLADAISRLPDADDETAMKVAEARFGE